MSVRFLPFLLLYLIPVGKAIAQDDGCEFGTAVEYLEGNDVRALITDTGILFFGGPSSISQYEIPVGSGISTMFAASLWMGGMVDGEVRMSATRHAPPEMWPGPIGSDPEECERFDRVFSISSEDLDRWYASGQPTPDMIDWPWEVGAPVTDGDGNPDNYDLYGGDVPELLGDQTMWWIMNDAGGVHKSSKTLPIQMEVTVTAFSSSLDSSIDHTTFFRYRLTYHGDQPLTDTHLAFYSDPDVGSRADYAGTDTTLGFPYAYNDRNNDVGGYGIAPPAMGTVILDAPVPFRIARLPKGDIDPRTTNYLTRSIYWVNAGGATQGDQGGPLAATRFNNFLHGRWGTGEPLTFGGNGLGASEIETRFMFPGESTTFYVAIVWSRGSSNLDSVRQLRKEAAIVKQVAPALLTPYYK